MVESRRTAVVGSTGMLARALQHCAGPQLLVWPSSRVDVRREESVEAAFAADQPRVVINASAWTDVDGAEERQEEAYALNQFGPGNLAAACARHAARLVHVSTDYVFDGRKEGAWVETDATKPLGAYGDSKLWGEREVQSRCPDHVIARTAWLYGPWSRKNFVDTMLRLTAARGSVDVVDDQWGSPTFSLDLAEALLFLAAAPVRGIFHVANAGRTTWCGLTREIVRLTGRRCEVRAVSRTAFPRPAPRPVNSALDTSKIAAAGHPMRAWEAGLEDYVKRFVESAAR